MKSILDNNPALSRQVAQIAEVAGYLWSKGWAERNGGNISVNVTDLITDKKPFVPLETNIPLPKNYKALAGNYFYVTGTGKRMRYVASKPMENGSIIRLNKSGDTYDIIADNPVAPTSELPSHFSMHSYMREEKGQDTKVVCHTHPTDLIAMTHNKRFRNWKEMTRVLWSMIPEARLVVPRGIGIIPYEIPGSMELADATILELDKHDVIMWEKHGCLAVGEDLIETFDMIDTLSKCAQIYITAKQMGFEPDGISMEELDDLVEAFNLPEW